MLCWNCNKDKDITCFYKSKIRIDQTGICKTYLKLKRNQQAHREWERRWRNQFPQKRALKDRKAKYKWRYNLAIEDAERMLANQNGLCAICNKHQVDKQLCLDHNHTTGKVRAFLCDKCNHALGMVNEDVTILQSMIDYLKHHNDI